MSGDQVIAVFDIGKTNKKFLLFNRDLQLVYNQESRFDEVADEDGFSCDNVELIEEWMKFCILQCLKDDKWDIVAVNIATYGATLAFLDQHGKRLTPVYNYLKPMPEDAIEGFYETYGGREEFCRRTASPALGMLNSGMQVLWLKKKRPQVFQQVSHILHFPQYLSHTLTHRTTSEFTSIGCHTAMWDFDQHCYHPWLEREGISLPEPVQNSRVDPIQIKGRSIKVGVGIHDSSASLVPYLHHQIDPFVLISTGTWCIAMNPFNQEILTSDELHQDTLCYMSIQQKQVKSSRLFLGHFHDANLERLVLRFGTNQDDFKKVKPNLFILNRLLREKKRTYFRNGVPAGGLDESVDLSAFGSFEEAYHVLVHDLVSLTFDKIALILPRNDKSKVVYITGGFTRNEIFVSMLSGYLREHKVFISDMDNATALGAAMVVYEAAFGHMLPQVDLGLKFVIPPGCMTE